ncbi:unnamed protein product [Moneuplotes crassus]|uniref:Mitochondrial import inner membrane translocase subunit TIM50 n=1 Tax=Euplotes crassus TaxID=5936 RepID=A0AAD1XFU9_EUPCR|nr:unnamed protein product [Moneuplotes crassus]
MESKSKDLPCESWDSCDYIDDGDLDPIKGTDISKRNSVKHFKVNSFDFLKRKGSVRASSNNLTVQRDSLNAEKNAFIAQMKCKSMREKEPQSPIKSEGALRSDSQMFESSKNKSKFRIFKEKANLKINLSVNNSEASKKQIVTKIPMNFIQSNKVLDNLGSLTPIKEKENLESEKEKEDTYEKYLQEIAEVGDLPHAIHISDEHVLQPGINRSSIPNNMNENSECAFQVFTARPNSQRIKVFNFLPSDIVKRIPLDNIEECKSEESNPFLAAQSLLIDSGATPIFKEPAPGFSEKNEAYWLASNAKADFDHADRYLYEFFNHKDYHNFKEEFQKTSCSPSMRATKPKKVCIGEHDPEKKIALIEIDKTIMLISEEKIEDMPFYSYIDKEFASHLGREPFYIYLRPFVFGFLKALMREYELVVYSKLEKKLLIFLLDILQSENEYFTISISHCVQGKPKCLSRFFTEGRSQKNMVLIDSSPEVASANMSNCVPIHPFKGEKLDVFLVYLRKYMLELSAMEDMSEKIEKDFSIMN